MQLRDISDRAKLDRENRAHAVDDLEVRASTDGKVTFDGVASVVDTPYSVHDMFGEYQETIRKGAFRKTLTEKDDVRLLVNHTGIPLARTKAKTLKLTAAPDLRAVAELDPANPTVQEIASAMNRGDLDQMSIGFRVHRQEWNGDYTERTILEAELFDVSVVTFPASPTTSASLRYESVDDFLAAISDVTFDDAAIARAVAYFEALRSGPAQQPTFTLRDQDDRDAALRRKVAHNPLAALVA
jgi:HK97 family phage prohead protease